jgi:CRISPR-associated protein (TIGR03986 family)
VAEFINPYTFLPLPAAIGRAQPAGHDRAGDGQVSGCMTVEWTLRTPLLLPQAQPSIHASDLVIPGSSVKGAMRSLHEALMGGCLRVMDVEFVPVYREPAVAKAQDWHLAIVTDATRQGRATNVRVTDETVWVPVGVLLTALRRVPRTGDTVDIKDLAVSSRRGLDRSEVTDQSAVTHGKGWTVLVGDSGTRLRSHRFFCAAGRMPTDDGDTREVAESAWSEYVSLCEGTNDLRLIRQRPDDDIRDGKGFKGWRSGRVFADVHWGGRVVGERRRVTGRLWPGDVVWARVNPTTGQVEHLAMAAIWRIPGRGPLAERVPEAVRACPDPEDRLCLSCRLFGSADTVTAESGREATQRSYAGHLRIGDAVADRVTTTAVRLAPLGSPRPGAGQFYLQIGDAEPASDEAQLPAAYWGSERDGSGARRVRGRKFYWHGDPDARQPPRHIARQGQGNEAMTGQRQLVPAGTVFRQEIGFDNVPKAELASLLLALLPGLVLPRTEGLASADYRLRLGGGKPLGLGSASVAVTDLWWQDARGRYEGQDRARQEAADFFGPLAADVARLAGHEVRRYWPTLSRILRADAVDPALIWYPLGGEWGDQTNRDRSFRFFGRTNGRFLARGREPVVALPDPDPAAKHEQRLRTAGRGGS